MNSGDYLMPKEIYDELFSDYIELVQKEEQLEQELEKLKKPINYYQYASKNLKDKNEQLQQENARLKDKLKNKPDAQITLQDDKGNKFMIIQTERIDMQVELNKTIEKLFNNWNKLKEYLHNVDVVIDYSENYDGTFINYDELIDKMQELEGSDSNENN